MKPTYRVVAVDAGDTHTGISIVDVKEGSECEIVDMLVVEANGMESMRNKLKKMINDELAGIAKASGKQPIVVLETVFNRNFALANLNKTIAGYFHAKGVTRHRYLVPTQKKYASTGYHRDKKAYAAQKMQEVIEAQFPYMLAKYNSYQGRKHDVAESLMMALYMDQEKARIFDEKTKKGTFIKGTPMMLVHNRKNAKAKGKK
jgi:Holliday junction resolvasome RuvABC endonuclease subunit